MDTVDAIRDEYAQHRRLTQREIAIVSLVAAGQSNKAIAIHLGVAPETIKTHLKRIFLKLSARTRAEAVVRAQS
jgi:LuxR family transcriptional regulator, maltose regulon positive regulatory protein